MEKNYYSRYAVPAHWLVAGLLPLLVAPAALAQHVSEVTGAVRTVAGAPIDYATVVLHRAADSAVVKTDFSDVTGRYRFEQVAAGRYLVSAAQVGYTRSWSAPFALPVSGGTLPPLVLPVSAATQLKEVQVVGQKPLYERLSDRTIVNVEGSTLAAGNTTLDVLSRAPGVTVDNNDNLALRGRQGVLVLIDGKRQPMTGQELADYLRALPADQLKSIELITNPPAKYDAQGGAGIIAINLKKDQRLGTNGTGTLSYGRGQLGKFTSSLSGNHRRGALNLFTSATYTRRNNFGVRNTYRSYYDTRNDQQALVGTADQRNYQTFSDHFLLGRFGADVNLSPTTTLGGVVTGFAVPHPRPGGSGTNTSTFYDANGQVQNYYTGTSTGQGYNPNLTANLNFRHTFGEAASKRELTADVDYARYYTRRLQQLTTFYERTGQPTTLLTGDQTGTLRIQAAKVDYTQPLSPTTTLEAGAKASRVYSDNDMLFENTVEGVTTVDQGRTNRFRYDELISAAYVNLTHTHEKLHLQAGLRGEQTHAKGEQAVAADNFRRDYYQLFPTASVQYTASDQHEWAATLSRRINRPSYRQLNPFRFVIDLTTSGQGNPLLRPETSYNVELTHTYQKKFSTSLSYSLTSHPITDVAQPESTTSTVSRYVNLHRQHYAALTLTAPLTPAKWWSMYNNAVFFYSHYQGTLAGTALNRGQGAFTLSSNSTFTFGNGWGAELNTSYYSRQREGFFVFQDFGQVALGLQKTLWDKKATAKLAATDLLYTMPLRATSRYTNYQENLYLRRDSRVLTLSLSWRLGNEKLTNTNRRSGAEDEKRRAQ